MHHRWSAFLLVELMACTGDKTTPAEFHPTLAFLAPADGSTVAAGDVQVSIVVQDFELTTPDAQAGFRPALPLVFAFERGALAHDEEGLPSGTCALSLDGGAPIGMATTQHTLAAVAAGSHTLSGELLFADGDPLEPPVVATLSFTAE